MPTYTIKALDAIKPEGDDGVTLFRFTITRAGALNPDAEFERVHLKLDTPDIDGFDGFSFDPSQGRVFGRDDTRLGVVFNPGEMEKTISVAVRGDRLVENDELIRLTLTSWGQINATESSVTARGIDGSAVSVVKNDDTAANHVAEQFHVNLVLKDGVIDNFERTFILNPPTEADLDNQLLDWIIEDLFAASHDGEFDGAELLAMDQVFLGKGIDGTYIPARDAEIEAAGPFDPAPEVAFATALTQVFAELPGGPSAAAFVRDILLGGGDISFAGNGAIEVAGQSVKIATNFAAGQFDSIRPGSDLLTFANGQRIYVDADQITFNNGVLRLDVQGSEIAGSSYRIYQAAFDRTPDIPGLKFWINKMDAGMSLLDVSKNFIASAEFIEIYGANSTNAQFVARLYQNVLGRDGEAAGITYWTGQLDTGASDRARVLFGFSESAENITGVSPQIDDGIFLS